MLGFPTPDELVRRCYAAAVAASAPGPHLRAALNDLSWHDGPTFLLAFGKGAVAMSSAAVAWATEHGKRFDGALVVAPELPAAAIAGVAYLRGDHPVPDDASYQAGAAIGEFVREMPADALVHLMISGGGSSLIAAPVRGISPAALRTLYQQLLRSGLDIGEMNAIRKRVTQWGGGKLAKALAPRHCYAWLLSDVTGDDPSTIASGPCSPDRVPPTEMERLVKQLEGIGSLDAEVKNALERPALPVGDLCFSRVVTKVIANNATALAGARAEAARWHCPQREFSAPLSGDAREAGRDLAIEAIRIAGQWQTQSALLIEEGRAHDVRPLLLYQGGETTVTVDSDGLGGRSQEVGLSAAEQLDVSPFPVTFLAAGTDGIDGPTDAAGALVNNLTWTAIAEAGIDPRKALAEHNSYPALLAAQALLKSGATGGNVMDLVIAVVGRSYPAEGL